MSSRIFYGKSSHLLQRRRSFGRVLNTKHRSTMRRHKQLHNELRHIPHNHLQRHPAGRQVTVRRPIGHKIIQIQLWPLHNRRTWFRTDASPRVTRPGLSAPMNNMDTAVTAGAIASSGEGRTKAVSSNVRFLKRSRSVVHTRRAPILSRPFFLFLFLGRWAELRCRWEQGAELGRLGAKGGREGVDALVGGYAQTELG